MTTSFKVAADVRYRVIGDEAVVVRQLEGDVLVLNEVAARVLQLAGEGLSQAEICGRLAGEFEAPEADLPRDVERFLAELEELAVLERVAAEGNGP
ncbi:MAG TPA: PqqD family protein [Chondromyces sp.]|nr:PqqD family protein [Chondromyces sp.]